MHYLTDRFRPTERRLIWVAALVLLPVFFFPVLPIGGEPLMCFLHLPLRASPIRERPQARYRHRRWIAATNR